MEIKTKHSVGDVVWFMSENKVINQIITSVHTSSNIGNSGFDIKTDVVYNIQFQSNSYREGDLFETKEALIQSL